MEPMRFDRSRADWACSPS